MVLYTANLESTNSSFKFTLEGKSFWDFLEKVKVVIKDLEDIEHLKKEHYTITSIQAFINN